MDLVTKSRLNESCENACRPSATQQQWSTMKYGYSYDRLTDAVSTENVGNETYAGRHDVHLTYDKLGNPLTIIREGVNADDGSVGLPDNATLSYDGNQLLEVTNNGFHDSSFDTYIHDKADKEQEYAYDANGNMTMDLNKGIKNPSKEQLFAYKARIGLEGKNVPLRKFIENL